MRNIQLTLTSKKMNPKVPIKADKMPIKSADLTKQKLNDII